MNAIASQRSVQSLQYQRCGHLAEGDDRQFFLERSNWRKVDCVLANIGLWVGVEHHGKKRVRNMASINFESEVRVFAVVRNKPRLHCCVCK